MHKHWPKVVICWFGVFFFFIAILKTIDRPEVPTGFVFCLFNDTLDYFINKLEVENKHGQK
jgi:hypothetical protein